MDFKELMNKWDSTMGRVEVESLEEYLHDAGYRLDPYPNGKSKDELIAIIEAKQAELDRARNLLHNIESEISSGFRILQYPGVDWDSSLKEIRQEVKVFLTETSTVKP